MSSDQRPADDSPTGPPADVPPADTEVPAPAAVPDAATLEQVATPAQRRRAPKISAFITTGVLVGAVVGWVLALLGTGTTGEGRTGAILLVTTGLAVLGAIVGAGLAAFADRRSTPRSSRRSARRSTPRPGGRAGSRARR